MSLVSTAAGLAGALITGGGGVVLGTVHLTGMEVPGSMPFGGTQQLAIHELPGGTRVIDAIGARERDIEWSGTFLAGSAVARARAVDAMRIAGVPVSLSWADFKRRVVIKEFSPDYSRSGSVVPYHISCVVLPLAAPAATATVASSVGGDLASALGISGLAASASSALATAQAAVPVAAVLTGGGATAVSLIGSVSLAGTALTAMQTSAGTALAGIGGAGGLFGGTSGVLGASCAQDALAASTNALSYVGRAAKNLLSL